ncbi:MAG: peptidylprolyl isomerase [Flavobacteriales bacterium]|nr:peptidylprolyl isomerase [Flavobacteriales bacterium]
MKNSILLLCLLALGCNSAPPTPISATSSPTNKWSDARLTPVLEAQDHRDSKALLAFLNDSSAVVREAAAMAFASVQDSTARGGLLQALNDADGNVRAAATWALSFVPDTAVANVLALVARQETDSATRTLMRAAAFRAWMKTVAKPDANALLDTLRNSTGYQRARVAEALRRLPKETLLPVEKVYVESLQTEADPDAKLLLMGGMKNFSDTLAKNTVTKLLADADPQVRIAALRAYAVMNGDASGAELLRAVADSLPLVRATAVELLQNLQQVDGVSCWTAGQENADVMVKIPLYGLAVKFGDEGTRNIAAALLKSIWGVDADPYVRAALINARASSVGVDTLVVWMQEQRPAVELQAAFTGAVAETREGMKRARYALRQDQYRQLSNVLRAALQTNDAGLIASAADVLSNEEADVIAMVLDTTTEQQALQALHPVRDLEARQVLAQAVAKRDGSPPPKYQPLAFNHAIDRARLAMLKNGQLYRIATTKGDIVLAIEPDAAPGTCAAFDSLVTSGYYNGTYFHRVVPNFVDQGGCPRGDGYGGMNWTMRTEIGLEGFVRGAVGIASVSRDTENCQFFIMLADAPHLDGRYTRFAHVVSGLENAQRLVVGDRMVRVARME